MFAERGFHGARIQDVAERARIAARTPYNHFADKDEVLSALLDERTEALLAQVRARGAGATAAARGFRANLEGRVADMLAYVQQHRALFAIANEHGLLPGPVTPPARSSAHSVERVETFEPCFAPS